MLLFYFESKKSIGPDKIADTEFGSFFFENFKPLIFLLDHILLEIRLQGYYNYSISKD